MRQVALILNGPVAEYCRSELFPATGYEAGAIMLLGINDSTGGLHGPERRYLSHSVVRVPDEDIDVATRQRFAWRKQAFLRLLKEALERRLAIGFVHSHRGVDAFFSEADNAHDEEVAELVSKRTKGQVDYVSMVVDEGGGLVARVFSGAKPSVLARLRTTLGAHWNWRSSEVTLRTVNAFDRQVLAFGPDFLKTLGQIRIGVIGAGATGSATATMLVRNGATDLLLVDPDIVEHTNLSRLHGATTRDADQGRSKVLVLAEYLCSFGLGTRVQSIKDTVTSLKVRDALKSCDLVFGCTDDHSGRLFMNRFAYYYNVPYVDMGILIDPTRRATGFITSADARVTVVQPGAPCLLCRNIIDPIRARDEDLERDDPDMFDRQLREGYVLRANIPNPAVITLTTSVASMAIEEVTARLTKFRKPVDHRVHKHHLLKDTFPGASCECQICGAPDCWGLGDVEPFLGRAGS